VTRPRLLDPFSGAGGAARGYQRAGFHVTGVDISPQPRYAGDEFIQADALEVLADQRFLRRFAALAGSPPCHDHTPLTSVAGTDGTGWMLAATRRAFEASGLPWVIENVPGAPMRADLKLCGCMFGLRVERVRWFELSQHVGLIPVIEHRHPKGVRTATRNRRALWEQGWNVSITGDVGSYLGPEAMGIDWMTGNELSQAVPPAYTEYVGGLLLSVLTLEAAS
jgi:DNA (cytosine-5)-methyltransferase 1